MTFTSYIRGKVKAKTWVVFNLIEGYSVSDRNFVYPETIWSFAVANASTLLQSFVTKC